MLASSIHINTSFRKRRLAQQQPAAAAVAWYQIISSYSIQDLVIKEDMIWFHTANEETNIIKFIRITLLSGFLMVSSFAGPSPAHIQEPI